MAGQVNRVRNVGVQQQVIVQLPLSQACSRAFELAGHRKLTIKADGLYARSSQPQRSAAFRHRLKTVAAVSRWYRPFWS